MWLLCMHVQLGLEEDDRLRGPAQPGRYLLHELIAPDSLLHQQTSQGTLPHILTPLYLISIFIS